MSDLTDTAEELFEQGLNCSQSVFAAAATQYGIDQRTALRLASPFGGGVARRGELCGAVAGALMALGLKRGAETAAQKEEIYRLSQVFMQKFKERHGSVICHDLIGCDLSTIKGAEEARQKGVFKRVCPALVKDAAEIVEGMLKPV